MWSRICTTWPENPHCGNCGVPFMNSTTSLDFTSLSMNCSMLMVSSYACSRRGGQILAPNVAQDSADSQRASVRNPRLQRQRMERTAHLALQRFIYDLVLLHARLAAERGGDHGCGIMVAVAGEIADRHVGVRN